MLEHCLANLGISECDTGHIQTTFFSTIIIHIADPYQQCALGLPQLITYFSARLKHFFNYMRPLHERMTRKKNVTFPILPRNEGNCRAIG